MRPPGADAPAVAGVDTVVTAFDILPRIENLQMTGTRGGGVERSPNQVTGNARIGLKAVGSGHDVVTDFTANKDHLDAAPVTGGTTRTPPGDDWVCGGSGDDRLQGNRGNDTLADRFEFGGQTWSPISGERIT